MDLEAGFIDALNNERLIHGVLKRLHIYQTNNDYQDYVQEAMIVYAAAYNEYLKKGRDMEKFPVYIFQKLLWRMTDLLRHEQRFFEVHSLEVLDFERVEQVEMQELFSHLELDDLSEFEKNIFYDCFFKEIPLKTLAEKYHCTPRNLRYHRNSVKEKICKQLS